MEVTSRLRSYWGRRSYQRLDGTGKPNMKVTRLGGKRKRTWRIRAVRKLKLRFKVVSPMKVLRRVRDAYVNMMLGLETKVGALNSSDTAFGVKRIDGVNKGNMKSGGDEFQAKLIFEIYKSLMASRELTASH